MSSRDQDETIEVYAMKAFSGVIKSKSSTKWSDIWPLLQENSECAQIIEDIGIERAHKVFCQCVTDIKPDVGLETHRHSHHKTRSVDQQQMRNIQSELDKAINGRPDSGKDCVRRLNYFTSPFSSFIKSKPSLSDTQTRSVNALYKCRSAPISSSVFSKITPTLSPTSSISSSPKSPNTSTRSLPCLPTAGNYSSSKQLLKTHQPSSDDYVIFTSSSATDRQERCLLPSMGYLEKSDRVFKEDKTDEKNNESVSDILNDISDDIERPYDSIPANKPNVSVKELTLEQLKEIIKRKEETEEDLLSTLRDRDKEIEKLKLSLKESSQKMKDSITCLCEREEDEVGEDRERDWHVEGQGREKQTKEQVEEEEKKKRNGSKAGKNDQAAAKLTEEDDLFSCKVYYEEKAMLQWQVIFTVVKNTEALQQYLKNFRPHAEEGQSFHLMLKSNAQSVEFDITMYHHEIPQGWEIMPHRQPLELMHTSIKKFGSHKYNEPPLCLIDVCANEGTDTAKRLHYKVPVLGVKKRVEIFINLTLRPKSKQAISRIESAACSRDPALTCDEVKEVRKIIQDILTEQYSVLDDLLKPSLKSVAANMFASHLLTKETREKLLYSDIMSEVISGMNFLHDLDKLKKHCDLFLQSLAKQDGPLKNAANSIAEAWTINIREKMDIKFECKT